MFVCVCVFCRKEIPLIYWAGPCSAWSINHVFISICIYIYIIQFCATLYQTVKFMRQFIAVVAPWRGGGGGSCPLALYLFFCLSAQKSVTTRMIPLLHYDKFDMSPILEKGGGGGGKESPPKKTTPWHRPSIHMICYTYIKFPVINIPYTKVSLTIQN